MCSKRIIRNFTIAILIALSLELYSPTAIFVQNIETIKISGNAAGVKLLCI
ncbi:hypothetical protein [Microcoleus sp. S13_C3]|uniref:hypothetical protein n=1 Tax=Microcoleus sp. S13_C3 TaxID=3055409 RepID=UPI002FD08381